MTCPENDYLIKFSLRSDMLKREVGILKAINRAVKKMRIGGGTSLNEDHFPRIVKSGFYSMDRKECIDVDNPLFDAKVQVSFMITTQSGMHLCKFAAMNKINLLNQKNVFTLGEKLLDVMEIIHTAGFVYNDLSFDNISLGVDQKPMFDASPDNFQDLSFHLWDYSAATPYLDFKTG